MCDIITLFILSILLLFLFYVPNDTYFTYSYARKKKTHSKQINGCEKSGLFQAFSEHMLHRLNIPLYKRDDDRIRITFLVRKTKYRQIINADELVDELQKNQSYIVRFAQFERFLFFLSFIYLKIY